LYLPNLKSVSLPVPELIGVAKNWSGPWLCPHSLSPPKKSYMSSIQTIWLYALFPRFSIAVWSGRCELQILGKGRGGRRGSGMVTVRKSVGEFLKAVHSNRFLYLCAFQRYCRFCSSARHFSLPHLYSPPNFPMFPWDRLFATESEGVGLIVREISFQDF